VTRKPQPANWLVILLSLPTGCEAVWKTESPKKANSGVAVAPPELSNSAAFQDTIGSVAYFDGLESLRVRGYGLVVGLGKNGAGECPRHIREQLAQSLLKMHRFSGGPVGTQQLSPEQMMDDPDTAVVLVRGEIPGGAVPGTRFDVSVSALPGTKAKSLRGGRLFTAELEVFRETAPNTSISGQVMARGAGPVFINPFADEDAATKANLLEGTVIGGGWAIKERDLKLVLLQPSYAIARKVQDRVNHRFAAGPKVANATSPSLVEIHVPKEFVEDTGHFLNLVRALYLSADPSFEAVRARRLAEEIVRPTAPHAMIAACFEGLGASARPVLADLYAHPQEHVSFHAAVAGVRLGDHIAADAIALHAENSQSRYRFQAIRALARAKTMANAAAALRLLLTDHDPRVRVAAYEALIERGDPAVRSTLLAEDNFYLDEIPGSGPKIVHIKRSTSRRIALFGDDLRCSVPVYYRAPDASLTINALPGDDSLTLLRVVPATGRSSPPVYADPELPSLVRFLGSDPDVDSSDRVTGLGLDYGAIVRALYHLCNNDSIAATFIMEEPNAAELFGPSRPEGRPESELGQAPSGPSTAGR